MTTLSHALSAPIIALTVAGIGPQEKQYILVAIAAAASLDLDHVYFLIRDRDKFRKTGYRGQLHRARGVIHEMLGVFLVSIISAVVFLFNGKLGAVIFLSCMVHLVEDFILGRSYPFSPFDKSEMKLFMPSFKTKGLVDLLVIIISVFLWKLYLNGQI